MTTPIRCAILTISDRSSKGDRLDSSGPSLAARAQEAGWTVVATAVVPDESGAILHKLVTWCDGDQADVILTTGGTGFAPRDITPEATQAVIQRAAPGIAEAMRQDSLRKTPHAMLSRGIAGIRKHTLIINLPGSPKAALENLEVVVPVIPHAVQLLQEAPDSEYGHQYRQT
jgi:molybdopterin adenylyltransferase